MPKLYLGGHVWKVQLDNGVAFGLSQYVQSAVRNVEAYVAKQMIVKWSLPNQAETPMQTLYRPELDVSAELEPNDASYYQIPHRDLTMDS